VKESLRFADESFFSRGRKIDKRTTSSRSREGWASFDRMIILHTRWFAKVQEYLERQNFAPSKLLVILKLITKSVIGWSMVSAPSKVSSILGITYVERNPFMHGWNMHKWSFNRFDDVQIVGLITVISTKRLDLNVPKTECASGM